MFSIIFSCSLPHMRKARRGRVVERGEKGFKIFFLLQAFSCSE